MKIIVLGAGAWGTALAVSACRNPQAQHQVTLWARDAAQTSVMEQLRENQRYLPGVTLPPDLRLSSQGWPMLADALTAQDLVIVASPMAGLRGLLPLLQAA